MDHYLGERLPGVDSGAWWRTLPGRISRERVLRGASRTELRVQRDDSLGTRETCDPRPGYLHTVAPRRAGPPREELRERRRSLAAVQPRSRFARDDRSIDHSQRASPRRRCCRRKELGSWPDEGSICACEGCEAAARRRVEDHQRASSDPMARQLHCTSPTIAGAVRRMPMARLDRLHRARGERRQLPWIRRDSRQLVKARSAREATESDLEGQRPAPKERVSAPR